MTAAVHIASGTALLALTVASCSTTDGTNGPISSAPPAPTMPTDTTREERPGPGSPSIAVALQQTLDHWFGAGAAGPRLAQMGPETVALRADGSDLPLGELMVGEA